MSEFFSKKCAIDRRLSTEYGPSLGGRGAKVGGLKCLSMAHFWQKYTSEFAKIVLCNLNKV